MYDDAIKNLLDSEWEEISGYAERFTFTAHLPDILLPEHEELIARVTPLVRHFIVHPNAENPINQAALLRSWTERYGAVFLVENIFRGKGVSSLEYLLPHLGEDYGLCMDTGHLLLEEKSPSDFFKAWQKRQYRIEEIHLHGLDLEQSAVDGRLTDHRRLRENEPWLLELLPLLKGYRGIINLEVFSWEEVRAGIGVLRKFEAMEGTVD